MPSVREITYYDVSPYAAKSANATANTAIIQNFSVLNKLFAENMTYRSLQTCEHNHTILDGSHFEIEQNENVAMWSKPMSLPSSRLLSENVMLEVSFSGMQSSPGITFYFDMQNYNWCDMLRIKWYNNNTLLSNMTFYPDAPSYGCINRVELYNKVTIEFMRMNAPDRYLKIESILFGIIRVFGDGELESLTLNEGFDPACRTLYINSAEFTINTKDVIPYMFMKRQPLYIKYNGKPMGTYYIDKSRRYADKKYTIEAVDKIGALDLSGEYLGGVYSDARAETVINNIVGEMFDVDIEESLKDVLINGWLPVASRRDVLAQIAMEIGAMITSSRDDKIKVRRIPAINSTPKIIDKSRVYQSATVDIELPYTGIELIEHNFLSSAGSAEKELFSDYILGEKTIKFTEPMFSYSITGGTFVYKGANYVIISGTGGLCTVKGAPYRQSQSSVTVNDEMLSLLEGTIEKTEKIDGYYLVNRNNSAAIAQRLFNFYKRQNVYEGDFLLDISINGNAEQVGDIVKVATIFNDDGGFITGQIEKLKLTLGSKNIKARGVIRGK